MSSAPIRRPAHAVRARHGIGDSPLLVCVSRLVARKGQDQLIRALPAIARAVPGVRLLIVGDGPTGPALCRLAARTGVTERVVFAGSVAWSDLPQYYAAGDVFAMPCRTRGAGLDVEGLGIVFLEAAAAGLPVIAGRIGRCAGDRGARAHRRRGRRPGHGPGRRRRDGTARGPRSSALVGTGGPPTGAAPVELEHLGSPIGAFPHRPREIRSGEVDSQCVIASVAPFRCRSRNLLVTFATRSPSGDP